MNEEAILSKAKELGARDAVIIPTSQVVVAHWVRLKCRYGCPDYGKWRTCPPYTPEPDTMKKVIAEYEKALLMKSISHSAATDLAVSVMFWLYSQGIFKAFPLGSGRCFLCDKCNTTHCPHPERAYPSMEACGIDVMETIKRAGWNTDPLEDGTLPHFCMVLLW